MAVGKKVLPADIAEMVSMMPRGTKGKSFPVKKAVGKKATAKGKRGRSSTTC